MAQYQLKMHKNAAKFLRKLPPRVRHRVRDKLDILAQDPYDGARLDIKPLAGEEGLWRLRVGSIRVIYDVQDNCLCLYILLAGNRGDVYNMRP